MTSDELNNIIVSSFKVLEEYCLLSCSANCCKYGFLRLNAKEAKYLIKAHPENMVHEKEDLVVFSTHPTCPCLNKENKCKLYSSRNRPNICKEYPIKVIGDEEGFIVIYHSTCKAVKEGIFNENIRRIRELGHIVIC